MLIDYLAADPTIHGPAGEELVDRLREVVDERKRKKQRDKAEGLVEQIDEWVEEDLLEDSIGALSTQLLERLAEEREDEDD